MNATTQTRFSVAFTFGQGSFRCFRINRDLFTVEQTGAYAAHIGSFWCDDITDTFSLEHKAMVQMQHNYFLATGELR